MKRPNLILLLALSSTAALAADPAPTPSGQPAFGQQAPMKGERLNVESIREKYWAKGDETDLRVVQNRSFQKAHKLELGVYVGSVSSDPFQTLYNVGATLGYHFSESFELDFVGWKYFVSPSSALQTLQQTQNTTADTNDPYAFYGGEVAWSPIYGKLSLLGKAIIHYDLHLLLGAGDVSTESGNYFSPLFGIGQQFYVTKYMSLRLDWRELVFSEHLIEKNTSGGTVNGVNVPFGQQLPNTRTNWSSVIMVGVTWFLPLGN